MKKEWLIKTLALGIVVLFIGISIMPLAGSFSVEKRVLTSVVRSCMLTNTRENILYVGGSGPDNYSSIQAAINAANPGDTVFVYDESSPYYEHIIVNKMIKLIGEDKNTTIIDGGGSGDVICIQKYIDGVTINGFTIQNSGNNFINGVDAVIEILSNYNNICGNIIKKNLAGIYCYYANNNTISDNIIKDSDYFGILLVDSCDNNIYRNIITKNHYAGIYITPEALPSTLGQQRYDGNNNIYENNISKNGAGIWFYGADENNFFENNVTNNDFGVWIDAPIYYHCDNNNIYNNNIIKNRYGVSISVAIVFPTGEKLSEAKNNKIYHNNFVFNWHNARDSDDNVWDDDYPSGGNYWSDYKGKDNNEDGIGDTPYLIRPYLNANKDRYPLMKPTENITNIPSIKQNIQSQSNSQQFQSSPSIQQINQLSQIMIKTINR